MKTITHDPIVGTTAVQYICNYILSDIKKELPSVFRYHNVDHAKDVMQRSHKYASLYSLDSKKADLLQIAAAGHDYGFVISRNDHEMISSYLVSILMSTKKQKKDDIQLVQDLIMATQVPQKPKTLMEKIIADADLDYLGRDDYNHISEKLYMELWYSGRIRNKKEWLEEQITFLENHRYHTDWALTYREPTKQNTLNQLIQNYKRYTVASN